MSDMANIASNALKGFRAHTSGGGIYDRAKPNTGVDTRPENRDLKGALKDAGYKEKKEWKPAPLTSEDKSAFFKLKNGWRVLHITSPHPKSNPISVFHLTNGKRYMMFYPAVLGKNLDSTIQAAADSVVEC